MVFNPPLTDQQFHALCVDNDVILFERTREGEILMQAPAGSFTSDGNSEIDLQLRTWWKTHRQGKTYDSSAGFHLDDGSVLSPDASYVRPEKLAGLTKDDLTGFPHLCPDFIIELLSVTDSVEKLGDKMLRWIENGAMLAWLIDPYQQQAHVYQAGREIFVESGKLLQGSGPVEGFTLDLEEVWRCYQI